MIIPLGRSERFLTYLPSRHPTPQVIQIELYLELYFRKTHFGGEEVLEQSSSEE